MAVNRVDVTINSRQYTVLAEESEEYLRKLAEHIDEKVKLILKGGHNILGERPLVLAALNICDEYYKCEEAGYVLQNQLAACTDKLNRANAEIKSLMEATPQVSLEEQETEEKLQKTEDELHKTENELQRAEDRIRSLEARISELERKAGNNNNNNNNNNRGNYNGGNNYNRNNYGRRN